LYDPKTLGLGVGLAAVFLFCGLLGFLYYRHRRAASSSKQQQRKKQQQQQARRVAHGEII
jgi:Tfp pilus assembly protein PilV